MGCAASAHERPLADTTAYEERPVVYENVAALQRQMDSFMPVHTKWDTLRNVQQAKSALFDAIGDAKANQDRRSEDSTRHSTGDLGGAADGRSSPTRMIEVAPAGSTPSVDEVHADVDASFGGAPAAASTSEGGAAPRQNGSKAASQPTSFRAQTLKGGLGVALPPTASQTTATKAATRSPRNGAGGAPCSAPLNGAPSVGIGGSDGNGERHSELGFGLKEKTSAEKAVAVLGHEAAAAAGVSATAASRPTGGPPNGSAAADAAAGGRTSAEKAVSVLGSEARQAAKVSTGTEATGGGAADEPLELLAEATATAPARRGSVKVMAVLGEEAAAAAMLSEALGGQGVTEPKARSSAEKAVSVLGGEAAEAAAVSVAGGDGQ